MECLAKAYHHHLPQNLSFNHYRPSSPQNPISLFAFTTPSSPSIRNADSHFQNPKPQLGPLLIPTVAIAASALFFMRLHQNPPIILALSDQELESEEDGAIRELKLKQKPNYVHALHLYKLEEGTIVRLLDVSESNDYESLKARIRSTTEWLECARRELEEVVEKDPGRVMEYSQVVDELMGILRDMDVYVDKCKKDNVRGYLRSCNRLLARVRKLESQIFDALRGFQEDEEEGD